MGNCGAPAHVRLQREDEHHDEEEMDFRGGFEDVVFDVSVREGTDVPGEKAEAEQEADANLKS